MLSAIPYLGSDFVSFVWGGFSVDNPTLNRFFSLHFLLPFLLAALVFIHLIYKDIHGSNNPLGVSSNMDKLPLHPYYAYKDYFGFAIFGIAFSFIIFFYPNVLGHSDNYIPANPLVTPEHIVPEWYLLPFYAILRSIPDKLGGVIAMLGAILVLLVLPFFHVSLVRSSYFRPLWKILFWLFAANFVLLGWIGGNPVEYPFVTIGQILTITYFMYFIVLVPVFSFLDNLFFFTATEGGL
jgi:ubiquinol-cytochrome c reductase cytochrome b subunit